MWSFIHAGALHGRRAGPCIPLVNFGSLCMVGRRFLRQRIVGHFDGESCARI